MSLELRGIAVKLKGREGSETKLVSFKVEGNEPNASVSLSGKSSKAPYTEYEWSGNTGARNDKKINLICTKGDARLRKRGRYRGLAAGAGDVIDVDITVTNPGSDPVTVEGFVEIG